MALIPSVAMGALAIRDHPYDAATLAGALVEGSPQPQLPSLQAVYLVEPGIELVRSGRALRMMATREAELTGDTRG